MKIYLAGPMRGYKDFNFPAFDFAAAKLREQGHEVFSPAERDRSAHGAEVNKSETGDLNDPKVKASGFSLREALCADTNYISLSATAIALLPGWEKSSGANAEMALAKALGLTQIILGSEFVQ